MLSLTAADASMLRNDACHEIGRFHDKAWIQIQGWSLPRRLQWEPCFVAHLCASMGDVARRWRHTLRTSHPGLQLTLSVVFTHQSPYVKWTSKGGLKRCELADLLIAFIDRTAAQPRGIATVIQAKQSDTGSVKLTTTSEQKQFELLSERPTFDVDDQAGPTSVDLSRKARDSALLYGLTPPDSPQAAPHWPHDRWHTAGKLASMRGTYAVMASDCLAATLVQMVRGKRGWYFDLPPGGADWRHFTGTSPRHDWAKLVNYLLQRSFSKQVKALVDAGGSGDRRKEHQMYFRATSPRGKPMLFVQYLPKDARGPLPVDWLLSLAEEDTRDLESPKWIASGPEEIWLGGRAGDAKIQRPEYEAPDDGPRLLSLAEQDTQDLESSKSITSGPEEIWPGGGAGDAKIQRPEYEAPDDGPISVILFEFSRGETRQ